MFDLEQIVSSIAFVGIRISGLFLFAPFFGSASMPMRIKASLVILLAWLLGPLALVKPASIESISTWITLAFGELILGLLLGLSVQFVFEASQLAGQILGVQFGFSLVHVLDPQSLADTPVLGLLQQTIVLMLFLALDIPNLLLRGIAHSFAYVPVGSFYLDGKMVASLLHTAGGLFLAGIQISAPALAATMLADIALGFLGKASPQLPVLFVGLSIKSVLGLAVLGLAVWSWPRWFEQAFNSAIASGETLLHLSH